VVVGRVHQKARPKHSLGPLEKRREIYGWLFAMPWILGLLIFYAYPLISSIIYSFGDFNGFAVKNWIGFENYNKLIADDMFWTSVKNTLIYTLMAVPFNLVLGVALALLLNMRSRIQPLYRIAAFIPTLVPAVAVAIIWQWLLNAQYGIINEYIWRYFRAIGPAWFSSPIWAKPAMVVIVQWTIGGTVLTYLASLQDVPNVYYEAATIDGANYVQKTMRITFPLITPVVFFNIIMSMIAAVQQFVLPFTITNGEGKPANSMLFYAMLLYRNAFSYLNMGMANAMAWMMFVLIMGVTLFVYLTSSKWVYYMGE